MLFFLSLAMLFSWFTSGGAPWVAHLALAVAGFQFASFGAPSGSKFAAGLRVDDEDRRAVFSSAQAAWLAVSCLILLAVFAFGWFGAQFIPYEILLSCIAASFLLWAQLGAAACAVCGRNVARHIIAVLCAVMVVGGTFLPGAALYITASATALCGAALWCAAWIKPGKISPAILREIHRKGRPEWFGAALFMVPAMVLCFFFHGLLPASLAGMAVISSMGTYRLDSSESERRLAWVTLYIAPLFVALPWLIRPLELLPASGFMIVWAVAVGLSPVLSGRSGRYALLVVAMFALSAATFFLPFPYGGLAAIFPAAALWLVRRFLYSAWLPLRAKRRRTGKRG